MFFSKADSKPFRVLDSWMVSSLGTVCDLLCLLECFLSWFLSSCCYTLLIMPGLNVYGGLPLLLLQGPLGVRYSHSCSISLALPLSFGCSELADQDHSDQPSKALDFPETHTLFICMEFNKQRKPTNETS